MATRIARSLLWLLPLMMLHTHTAEAQDNWIQGKVEAALATAEKTNRPLLLYWGAVWCPPCNQLKDQVFSDPRFESLTKSIIKVYLDGDQPMAQQWGETLAVKGYPTVLLLNPQGRELLRINTSLSFEEFAAALDSSLTHGQPVAEILQMIRQEKADERSLARLSFLSWQQLHNLDLSPADRLQLIAKAAGAASNSDASIRGSLYGHLLTAATTVEPSTRAGIIGGKELLAKWQFLVENPRALIAGRSFVLYYSRPWLEILQESSFKHQTHRRGQEILTAAAFLAKAKQLGISERFRAETMEWTLHNTLNPNQEFPAAKKTKVREAMAKTLSEAQTPFQRLAVVPTIAWTHFKMGDSKSAEELLKSELKTTKSPWYYQSYLSRIAEKNGDDQRALLWAARAKQSAQGRASKLQWSTNYLLLLLRQQGEPQQLITGFQEFYDLVFQLEDGFYGRNLSRLERLAKAGNQYSRWTKKLRDVLFEYSRRCKTLSEPSRQRCKEHLQQTMALAH